MGCVDQIYSISLITFVLHKPIALKLIFHLVFILFINSIASAQTIFTSIFNTSGGAKQITSGTLTGYSFEWSVGESSIITTNSAANYQVNHGLLQGFLLNDPQVPTGDWFPDELKIYPNPVRTNFTVELLSTYKGLAVLQLFTPTGQLVQSKIGRAHV